MISNLSTVAFGVLLAVIIIWVYQLLVKSRSKNPPDNYLRDLNSKRENVYTKPQVEENSFSISNNIFRPIMLFFSSLESFGKKISFENSNINLFDIRKNGNTNSGSDIKLLPKYKRILEEKCDYYNKLNSSSKKIYFEKRVQIFINIKEFIPRGSLTLVTDEMKVLIAASAIQITFGYPEVFFAHFRKILVYPDEYKSTITNNVHQGEVNLQGFIVLSWEKFKQGYANSKDGRNLGLHEMAHALRLENGINNREFGFLDPFLLARFQKMAKLEIQKINEGKSHFFRKYAGTNEHEFFAVVVENFFEIPNEMKNSLPQLYDVMCKLLRQDPLGIQTFANRRP